jgi:hypothetical protein
MKYFSKHYFNLVEVALAIGILAIGVTAIMSLFPIGFERSREAIGENYCAEAADSLFSYIARETTSSSGNWTSFFTNELIPTSKASFADDKTDSAGDWISAEGDVYTLLDYPDGQSGVYGIKVQTGDVTDFTGQALLWQSNLPTLLVSDEEVNIPNTSAVGVNLEISWPVEKPYSKRKKNYYYFELYNSNS